MVPAIWALWACSEAPPSLGGHGDCEVELVVPEAGDLTIGFPATGAGTPGWAALPPLASDGEIVIGEGGRVQVRDVPVGSEVTLYRSFGLQGDGPCDFMDLCMTIVDPEIVATMVAGVEGDVLFELDPALYLEPTTVAFQSTVFDPATGEGALTESLYRHVAIPQSQGAIYYADVSVSAELGPFETGGNTHAGGQAWVDVNNDYWADLFIANGSGRPNYLWLNRGDGSFLPAHDRVVKADLEMECSAARYADVDNDGDMDIMMPVDNGRQMNSSIEQPYEGGPNILLLNDGTGHFVDFSDESGVVDPRGWRNSDSSFADYDRDGCIDLYLVNWAMAHLPAGDNFDRLLHGNCDGTFTDVSDQFNLDQGGRDGLVSFFWDADFDLYPELYVGNNSDILDKPDWDPDGYYYKNIDGVAFADWTGTASGLMQSDWAAMGADVGDIDLDGDWDLYVTDVYELLPVPRGNSLYVGSPDGHLTPNACQAYGVCVGHNTWGSNFMDVNRDMWPDLWVGTSLADDPEFLYVNRADGTGRMDRQVVDGWLHHRTRAGSISDYDGDGDVDLFIWDTDGPSRLYRAGAVDTNGWMEFRLFGQVSNAAAIGAVVRVTAGGQTQMRRVSGNDSAHSMMDNILHFGMAKEKFADVEITWPSGIVTTLDGVAVNELVFVDELDGRVEEELTIASATYDAQDDELSVTLKSTFGGRPTYEVSGIGTIAYDVESVTYHTKFLGVTVSDDTLTVRSSTGAEFILDVETN